MSALYFQIIKDNFCEVGRNKTEENYKKKNPPAVRSEFCQFCFKTSREQLFERWYRLNREYIFALAVRRRAGEGFLYRFEVPSPLRNFKISAPLLSRSAHHGNFDLR